MRAGRPADLARPAGPPSLASRLAGRADDEVGVLSALAADAGLARVRIVAWRDLDDPEAGGSELHAHRIAALWAAAGIEVTLRTSAFAGAVPEAPRDGYKVVRRNGRYGVFPAVALEGRRGGEGRGEPLVEIWNGMPFFSPIWHRGPRLVLLHHVHAEMWRMVLPGLWGRAGQFLEHRLAPAFYRSSRVVTLSESSRDEIIDVLHLPAERISVAAPGIGEQFSPGGTRAPHPLVVAVGRLVPVKRFDLLMKALAAARERVPNLEAVIVGEGYERPHLEALRRRLGAESWLELPGRLPDTELVRLYRRAWVVASASLREGWGMTLTEAAACGTPAVATAIAGHRDAVVDGHSGVLVHDPAEIAGALVAVLTDGPRRRAMERAALERSRWFTWGATARGILHALTLEMPQPAG